MIVKETRTKGDIDKVLKHPDVYDRIAGDNCPPPEGFEAPITDEYQYIGGYVNNDIIGLMIYPLT